MAHKYPGDKVSLMADLVEYSRKLGADPNLVLHGGGNTSVKLNENDHTGKSVISLRVKGSGSDLASISADGFTGLRLEDLLAAKRFEAMNDIEMMDYLQRSMLDPKEPSPSVETFLHAFIDDQYVFHSHSDAILSITNTNLSDAEVASILPDTIVFPYVAPGFKLARAIVDRVSEKKPNIKGIILRKHGLFTFGSTAQEAYERHISIVKKANAFIRDKVGTEIFEIIYDEADSKDIITHLAKIRGKLSTERHKILSVRDDWLARTIARSREAEIFSDSGPATPDMLIRTKYAYLYTPDFDSTLSLIDKYAENYRSEYAHFVKDYPMHDPFPSAIVVRGFGIITSGISKKEADIVMDQIIHSIEVNARASRIAKHEFISKKDAYSMEYWPLEEAKLRKAIHKKLQGKISLVTGAASGIGLVSARRLAENGSVVVACDLDPSVKQVSEQLSRETGSVVYPRVMDISSETDVISAFSDIIRKFGGIDVLFNNAGILKSAPLDEVTVETLNLHYKVNSLGTFLMTREAFKIMKNSGLGGNIVFNITKNLTNPGPEMLPYGTSKAFAAHVCHYVAKEGGRYGIRANIINPDKIFRGSKIWENGVLEARAKAKGQTVEQYKTQNLLRREVLPDHVANMLLAIIDENVFGATTDAMIPVDGGII
ncbi:bifunctional aldolase/short-chain dehydrogenase [Thermoplasmatales archaeon AK]|nr:bifunctional aldolase/short-chain dehydrogenase [Thermoplasmatales archaeon AK]